MGNLKIRAAERSDIGVLVDLIGGFRDQLAARLPSDDDLSRTLPEALGQPDVEFCCAWLDGRAAGYTQTRFFTSVWAGGVEAFLEDLFVVPRSRGQAVGRSLLRHAIVRAEARGARRFSLNTNERNETAQALYQSESLRPQSHALYPGGREILWVRTLGAAAAAK